MSMQQVLEVVRRHHVFWHKELSRASDADVRDCEFFRRQCQDEVAWLEAELGLPFAQRIRNVTSRKRAESALSNARPATTKIGGKSTGGKATPERRNLPRS